MIRMLLRRPASPAEVIADAVRVVAAVGIIVAGIGWGPMAALSLAVTAAALLLPRLLDLRPGFDIAFGAITLASTWSSVLDLYLTARWWDIPMHFLTNGIWAAVLYIVLVRFEVITDAATLPRPVLSAAVMTTALGLSLGVFWEIFEWFGHTFIDSEIFVGYRDSIGDLAVGGLGSLLAGLGMRLLLGRARVVEEERTSPEAIG